MNTSTGSRSSRNIWISLFIIGTALDLATTFVGLNDPNTFGYEINPIAHYFGWPFFVFGKLFFSGFFVWILFVLWDEGRVFFRMAAITTTILILVSFSNMYISWNPEVHEAMLCVTVKFKHVQEILGKEFSATEVQQTLEYCRLR